MVVIKKKRSRYKARFSLPSTGIRNIEAMAISGVDSAYDYDYGLFIFLLASN